jgi:hypothetical protein
MASLLARTFDKISRAFGRADADPKLANEPIAFSSERGVRATPENELKYVYRQMWVDPDTRETILAIRQMDREDPRVKSVHARVARDTIRGGLLLQLSEENDRIAKLWDEFATRLQLHNPAKLQSDARGLVMEGNLPMQWVLDQALQVVAAVRMPSETILPNVGPDGRFTDPSKAYYQIDVNTGQRRDVFPLWQLTLCRFGADNYDDLGAMGRPFLDASRVPWQKLRMTEQDLVVRRRTRAPLRLAHTLEGATKQELEDYRARVESDQKSVTTDYYLNKKGSVSAIQGDSTLSEIEDVVYLLDAFFSGSPVPKGLMGYTEGMNRDILEDIKKSYFEEIDVMQDLLAWCYDQGFRLQLLLNGINPDASAYYIKFAERRTETPNQIADRGLKLQALGLPESMIWEEMGYNPEAVRERRKADAKHTDPYPEPDDEADPLDVGFAQNAQGAAGAAGARRRVSITPGNAPKGESATAITNR